MAESPDYKELLLLLNEFEVEYPNSFTWLEGSCNRVFYSA